MLILSLNPYFVCDPLLFLFALLLKPVIVLIFVTKIDMIGNINPICY